MPARSKLMDSHGEDMLDVDTATDFPGLVILCLDNLNLLKNKESFKFHVEQCKGLCRYIVYEVSPYIENKKLYLDHSVWSKSVRRAWKETYRAVKEAETYVKHCSTDVWRMKCFILANTGEAFALHMHDVAWSLLCLDLALLCPIEEWNDSICLDKFRNRICGFFAEMSGLHLEHFGFKFQDYCHLLMACNQTAAKAWTSKQKNKIGVLQFMERKLLETIKNECKIEFATGRPTWLQIPRKDLILKEKTIGKGSFGVVYEGSWLGHKVAVKDIPIDARDLFDRETAVLAKLQSPFIVQMIGTCIEGSHCYVVMELVSSSLDKLLKISGGRAPLTLPVAVDMMLQISRGMEYLHRQGIMHMDLKASNVLIEPSAVPEFRKQRYGRVKLCDFGMASLSLSSFRCEDPKGTCYWRAPEAFPIPNEELLPEIDTLEEYTYKADVYSFAMTCYEILTGKQPFLDVQPKKLYRLIQLGRRPVLQPSSCPAMLADYIAKCWETDPGRRPCFAQVSSFMRNMKLFILRMDDPRDWCAKSDGHFYPPELFLQLVTYKEAAFDESPEEEKMSLTARVLGKLPSEIKRRYHINLAEAINMNSSELKTLLTAEVLGHGSFGSTYRTQNFCSLVFKRLSGDTTYLVSKRDFERRLQALGILKHANLVSLRGYHISKEETLLVYEYLPNGSLYSRLQYLDWDRRMEIAMDVAAGLAFLHKSGFLHGNVKPSNILLDGNGTARLADSCLAGMVKAYIFSEYMSPEQIRSGKIYEESDVYSFGMVLLALLTGKNPLSVNPDILAIGIKCCIDLPAWILSIGKERWIELLDGKLTSDAKRIENMLGMLEVALHCVYSHPRMSDVLEMIKYYGKSCSGTASQNRMVQPFHTNLLSRN